MAVETGEGLPRKLCMLGERTSGCPTVNGEAGNQRLSVFTGAVQNPRGPTLVLAAVQSVIQPRGEGRGLMEGGGGSQGGGKNGIHVYTV